MLRPCERPLQATLQNLQFRIELNGLTCPFCIWLISGFRNQPDQLTFRDRAPMALRNLKNRGVQP